MSINVSGLSLFENFNGTTGRDGFPGKRQKLVPGQTFGKEREIAVTTHDVLWQKFTHDIQNSNATGAADDTTKTNVMVEDLHSGSVSGLQQCKITVLPSKQKQPGSVGTR